MTGTPRRAGQAGTPDAPDTDALPGNGSVNETVNRSPGPGSEQPPDNVRQLPGTWATPAPSDLGDLAESSDGTPARRLVLTPASQIRIRPVRWLWEARLPLGAIALVPGREGIGKSLFLAWLAARVTRGQLPGELYGQPRPVIYAATEDDWSYTIAPRLVAAGADLDMVYRVDVDTDGLVGQLTLPRDCEALAAEIRRMGVALLAADPLLSLISSSINSNRDQELRTALEPLARLAGDTGCSVVGLAHFNKSAATDALTLITGSRAFAAVARAVLAIAFDPASEDGSCVLSQEKNNLGRTDLPSLRYVVREAQIPTDEDRPAFVGVLAFTGESDRSVSDILAESGRDPGERSKRDDAADWLIWYLASQGGSAPREEILRAAQAEGIAERTLKRVQARLERDGATTSERSGFPPRATWRLVDTASPAPADDCPASGSGASQTSPVGPRLGQLGHATVDGPNGPTVAQTRNTADTPSRQWRSDGGDAA